MDGGSNNGFENVMRLMLVKVNYNNSKQMMKITNHQKKYRIKYILYIYNTVYNQCVILTKLFQKINDRYI